MFRILSSVIVEWGFGDDFIEKSNEKIECCFFFIKKDKGKLDKFIYDNK